MQPRYNPQQAQMQQQQMLQAMRAQQRLQTPGRFSEPQIDPLQQQAAFIRAQQQAMHQIRNDNFGGYENVRWGDAELAEIDAFMNDLPADFSVVDNWDNEELTPVDVEGYEGVDFYVDPEGFLLDGDGDFLLDDAGQLINQNNQYVIDQTGEWLLVDTEGAAILGVDNGNWNIGFQDAALGLGAAAAVFYGVRLLARNFGQSQIIPKEVKRRFKMFSDPAGGNNAAVHDESAEHDRRAREPIDDPATNFRRQMGDEEESKASDLLPKQPNQNPAGQGSMSDSLMQLKDSISEDTRNLFNGVASGVKNIKEKVVGKSAKKAQLVTDDDEEDPCQYQQLDEDNQEKSIGKEQQSKPRTKTVWTTEGPVEIDERTGIRIQPSKKQSPGRVNATQEDGDTNSESAVDILSYKIDSSEAIQLDTLTENSDAVPSQPSPQGGPASDQTKFSSEMVNPLANETDKKYFPEETEELPDLQNDEIPIESGYMRTDENL